MKYRFAKQFKAIFIFSLLIVGCNETHKNKESSTSLSIKVNEFRLVENGLLINIVAQNSTAELIEFNLYGITLFGKNGEECGIDIFSQKQPDFPVNKKLNKGEKASGWLVFKFPSSSFEPNLIIFKSVLSPENYGTIDVKELLKGKNVDSGTINNTYSETNHAFSYPVKGEIKEIRFGENIVHFYIKTESTVEEIIEFNLYSIKLISNEGAEVTPEIFGGKEPEFPVNKEFYKGDKAAGWITFKLPSKSFIPEKITFSEMLGSSKYLELHLGHLDSK